MEVFKSGFQLGAVAAQLIVDVVLASDFSLLFAAVMLHGFDFLLKAAELGLELLDLVVPDVGFLASFVALEALVTEDGLKLVDLLAEGLASAVLLVNDVLHLVEGVLVVVKLTANFISTHSELAIVLVLISARHGVVVLCGTDFLSDHVNVAVALSSHVAQLLAQLSDGNVLLSVHGNADLNWGTGVAHRHAGITHRHAEITHGRAGIAHRCAGITHGHAWVTHGHAWVTCWQAGISVSLWRVHPDWRNVSNGGVVSHWGHADW